MSDQPRRQLTGTATSISSGGADSEVYSTAWNAVTLVGTGTGGRRRTYFAEFALWSARRSARLSREREDELVRDGVDLPDAPHRAEVINSVLCAAVFLEGFVNELFCDIADKPHGTVRTKGLSAEAFDAMRWAWRGGAERSSALDKYQLALECAQQPRFVKAERPFLDAALLVRLRNEIVHYKSVSHNAVELSDLHDRLRERITDNRQPLAGNFWFPDRALSAGCAEWACTTVEALADQWQKRLGLEHDYHRDALATYPDP